jgi:hypothetical protein
VLGQSKLLRRQLSNCSLNEPPEKPNGLRATRNAACDDKQVLPYCLLEQ